MTPGWKPLIEVATRTGEWETSVDNGSLLLTRAEGNGIEREEIRGTRAAAKALSREICDSCSGPGDPVWPASGRGGTRCTSCRTLDDEVLPRTEWHG